MEQSNLLQYHSQRVSMSSQHIENSSLFSTDTVDLNNLQEVVRSVLAHDPKTRDDDLWLIIETLRKLGFKIFIEYNQIKNIPSFESITRCRRKIQYNDNQFLPTNPEVLEKRMRRAGKIKEWSRN